MLCGEEAPAFSQARPLRLPPVAPRCDMSLSVSQSCQVLGLWVSHCLGCSNADGLLRFIGPPPAELGWTPRWGVAGTAVPQRVCYPLLTLLSPYFPLEVTSEQFGQQGCEVPEESLPGSLNSKWRENHRHTPSPTKGPSRAARDLAMWGGP